MAAGTATLVSAVHWPLGLVALMPSRQWGRAGQTIQCRWPITGTCAGATPSRTIQASRFVAQLIIALIARLLLVRQAFEIPLARRTFETRRPGTMRCGTVLVVASDFCS